MGLKSSVTEFAIAVGNDIADLAMIPVFINTSNGETHVTLKEPAESYFVHTETNSPETKIEIKEQTNTGFKIAVLSSGVHYTNQPIDCSEITIIVMYRVQVIS